MGQTLGVTCAADSTEGLTRRRGAGKWGHGWTFTFSLLGIAPLAERLGFVTEQLASYTNRTLGTPPAAPRAWLEHGAPIPGVPWRWGRPQDR